MHIMRSSNCNTIFEYCNDGISFNLIIFLSLQHSLVFSFSISAAFLYQMCKFIIVNIHLLDYWHTILECKLFKSHTDISIMHLIHHEAHNMRQINGLKSFLNENFL